MELHAIWDRIDQLEKMAKSQAKEIDDLKKIIKENHLTSFDHSENHRVVHRSMGPFLRTNNNTSNIVDLTTRHNNTSTVNRNSSVPAFNPYHMNSHVHPSSAIPPIGAKPVVSINLPNRTSQGGLSIYGDNRLNHGSSNIAQEPKLQPRFSRLPLRLPPTSTALNRHSIHGTRLDSAFNLETDEESTSDSQDNHIRQNKQSFVELLSGYGNSSKDDSRADDRCKRTRLLNFLDSSDDEERMMDQEQQVDSEKLKVKQLDDHDSDDGEIKLVSYTEPDHQSNNDLTQYLVGRVIEKNQVPRHERNTNNEPPHIIYNFRKIYQSPETICKRMFS